MLRLGIEAVNGVALVSPWSENAENAEEFYALVSSPRIKSGVTIREG
jgi:hypothetical protein